MRTIVLVCFALLCAQLINAQQSAGKVIYERTLQVQIHINDNDEVSNSLPKTRTDKFEMSFANNQSIYKHVDEDDDNEEFGGNGMQIRMVGPGQNDIIFCDFASGKRVEQREMFDKKFVVEDSIRKLNWKLTGETQTILGHAAQKATAQNITRRLQMTMDNGKMERKEIPDTSMVTAWFTTDFTVPAGPEVPGQLPGLILALDMNDGRMVYKAIEISPKADLAAIKEPGKGKRLTPAEFNTERDKMLAEMEKNNQGGGGNRIIIRN